MKVLIWATALILLAGYQFWECIEGYLGLYVFEALNALCIASLAFCLYKYRPEFITFFLLCAAINNFYDEITWQTDKLYLSEVILLPLILIFWYYKTKNNVRKI